MHSSRWSPLGVKNVITMVVFPSSYCEPFWRSHYLPAKLRFFRVEPKGFEPLTSAVQRRPHTLLEFSGACKTPANTHISSVLLFPSVQEIYSGCCTVAAHLVLSISRSYASTIAMAAALGYPTDDLVTSGPDEESRLSLIRAQEPDILGLLYRLAALRGPSVTLDRQMDRGHCVGRYSDPVTLIWGAARSQKRPAHEEHRPSQCYCNRGNKA